MFPYLLRKLKITRVNQVWAAVITYIPLTHRFAYSIFARSHCSRSGVANRGGSIPCSPSNT